ncbi:MAG: DNA double-strand break repair nuclease NurA [Pyrobaculum sp.]
MEEETLQWLEPDLIVALRRDIERHVEKLSKISQIVEEIASLREKVEIKEIPPPSDIDIYAVDSSYGSPPLELVGGVFTIIAYGYVGVVRGTSDKFVTGAIYFNDGREDDLSKRASLLEKRMASRLLAQKTRGEKKFDLLLLDGEVSIHPLPYNLATRQSRHEEINRVVDTMLKNAALSKTTIAAITKRVRSRYLSIIAGRCLPINDKIVATAILKPGEYMSIGRLRDILPKWAAIHYAECEGGQHRESIMKCVEGVSVSLAPRYEKLCKRLREFGVNFEAVLTSEEYPSLKHLGDVEVVYYKPLGHATAVRVEILDLGGVGVDKLVSYLASTTSHTGFPHILDAVDQYVRVTPELVEAVLTTLFANVPKNITYFMWPTNMQKRLAGRY